MATSTGEPAEAGEQPPQMIQLASFTIPAGSARIKPYTLRYCPTMDLIAAAHEDESWNVWRLGGSRVFGGTGFSQHNETATRNATRVSISAIEWKSNGMFLAIACSDNAIRLVSSYTGKVVHVLPTDSSSSTAEAMIGCLGWDVNVTDPAAWFQRLEKANGNETIEELLGPASAISSAGAAALKADLPRDLALIDVEASFPKLSTLPATGVEDDVFSSRQSIDAMFHENNSSATDQVDVLLAGFTSGHVHLRMFDSFEIGSINVGSAFASAECKIIRHCSHSLSSVHALIVEKTSASSQPDRFLVPVSLRFVTASPRYLSVVAAKATQLQNLLRYIQQVQAQINYEWKTAQELPTKFLSSINEDLVQNGSDFVTAAYHLVATGDCLKPLKEFLVDTLGERGHKRWEKAVSNGYETMRRLVHECLLPSIERCQVVVSRLRGLANVWKAGGVLGIDQEHLDFIDDTLDMLNLLGHKLLIIIGKDVRQFRAFEKWLKLEIEFEGMDEQEAEYADNFVERQDNIEHRLVLDYISGPMSKSKVLNYIRPPVNKQEEDNDWKPPDPENLFYETYQNIVADEKKLEEDELAPRLNELTSYLRSKCAGLFSHIADGLRKGIILSNPISLPKELDGNIFDVKMLPASEKSTDRQHFVAVFATKQGPQLAFHKATMPAPSKTALNVKVSSKCIDLEGDYEIIDVRFVDDHTAMVLRGNSLEARIESWNHSDLEVPLCEVKHVFDYAQDKARPIRLEVNGRKGRRVVCVLFEDRRRYAVFDIDNMVEQEDGKDDEGDEMEQD